MSKAREESERRLAGEPGEDAPVVGASREANSGRKPGVVDGTASGDVRVELGGGVRIRCRGGTGLTHLADEEIARRRAGAGNQNSLEADAVCEGKRDVRNAQTVVGRSDLLPVPSGLCPAAEDTFDQLSHLTPQEERAPLTPNSGINETSRAEEVETGAAAGAAVGGAATTATGASPRACAALT